MAFMAKGWIKLHRQLLDNSMWLQKPFTKGQAWVDLILLADGYSEGKYKRGTVYRSQQWLAERWGWSRGKVIRFLDYLEENHMVTVKRTYNGTQSGTTITLVKYSFFQDKRTPNDTTNDTTNESHIRSKEEYTPPSQRSAEDFEPSPFGEDPLVLLERWKKENGN